MRLKVVAENRHVTKLDNVTLFVNGEKTLLNSYPEACYVANFYPKELLAVTSNMEIIEQLSVLPTIRKYIIVKR